VDELSAMILAAPEINVGLLEGHYAIAEEIGMQLVAQLRKLEQENAQTLLGVIAVDALIRQAKEQP
jgi:hypothetical protein